MIGVVEDINIFMNAFTDGPIKGQAYSVFTDLAPFNKDGRIGQMKARGIETQLAGIDQLPGLMIDVETVGADEASIDGIHTLVARSAYLSTLIRHHKRAPLTDCNPWWGDFNFYWHTSSPVRMS